jgi:hypothetical protein
MCMALAVVLFRVGMPGSVARNLALLTSRPDVYFRADSLG